MSDNASKSVLSEPLLLYRESGPLPDLRSDMGNRINRSPPLGRGAGVTSACAPDDVVATMAQAGAAARPPLIVLERLQRFLDERDIGTGEVVASPLGDGHSNVTYELRRKEVRVVLRRPPRPPLPPSAHDVLREARLLKALRPTGVRVPQVLAICPDEGVIGAPFFIMERIDGEVLGGRLAAAFDTVSSRAQLGEELIDALVELHAVDYVEAGLEEFGRAEGYLERQVRRFGSLWESQRTREVPEVDQTGEWLERNRPARSDVTIVHGDYRLGNVMFDRANPRLRAILDWEMATLGDPLADLGYLCATWAQPGDHDNPMNKLSAVTREPGFPTSAGLRETYAKRSGRSVDGLRFYEVLALWKAAIFLESSYRRFREGTTDDPYFRQLERGVPELAQEALSRTLASSN